MLRAIVPFAIAILGVLRAAQDESALSAAQRDAIARGESVVLTRTHSGSAWPAVTVLLFVAASPEEVAAVFVEYELHRLYIPRVKRSTIARVIDATTIEVDYTVELPFLSDERYTVRNRLARAGANGFRVDWTLVKAISTKSTVGYARFEPYANARAGRNGTLLVYHNFVTPGSRLASFDFITMRAVRQVEETARAVAQRVEMERKQDRSMADRLKKLRSSLPP